MHRSSKILITGAQGLVGKALSAELKKKGFDNLVLLSRKDCDLTNQTQVASFFKEAKPEIVFHLAASVYGIGGNLRYGASSFTENLLMNSHVIEASRINSVQKIIAMGSVAAYPEASTSPIKEEMIWNGLPHDSESGYSHAKRTMLAQLLTYQKHYDFSYAYILATNLFGPHDNFDEHLGHVIPSLIKKFYKARETNSTVTIWGNGTAIRDFLYSNEMARALVLIMEKGQGPINVGSGRLISITYLVDLLAKHFDMPRSRIFWDSQKPNGRSFAELDLSRLKSLDFRPISSFEEQLKETVHWFLSNAKDLRE